MTHNCPEYLREARDSLKMEEDKVDNFLDKETKPLLLDAIQTVIIKEYAGKLAEVELIFIQSLF